MIGVGNIEISHICPRKNVRPFIVHTPPVQLLLSKVIPPSAISSREYLSLVPRSTKPHWSSVLWKACIMLKGFESPPFFSVKDKISLKSPTHTHGREAWLFRCPQRYRVSHFLRVAIHSYQLPLNLH